MEPVGEKLMTENTNVNVDFKTNFFLSFFGAPVAMFVLY